MDSSTEGSQAYWQNMGFTDGEDNVTLPQGSIPQQYLASFDSGYAQGASNIPSEDNGGW